MRWSLAGLVCLGMLCLFLGACSSALEGRILVVGNEPFAVLVLRTEMGDLELSGPLLLELGRLQNRRVRLAGRLAAGGSRPGLAGRFEVGRMLAILD